MKWFTSRREEQWMERDPIGYIRFALNVPPEVTDEEIEHAVTVEMPEAIRAMGISMAEAGEAFAAIGKAAVEADATLTNPV